MSSVCSLLPSDTSMRSQRTRRTAWRFLWRSTSTTSSPLKSEESFLPPRTEERLTRTEMLLWSSVCFFKDSFGVFFCFELGVFFIARCFVHSNTALCSFDHYCGENRHILRIWPQLAFWFLKIHSLDPMISLRSSSIQPSLFYKQKPHFSKRKSTVQWFLFPPYVLSTFRIFRWLNIKGTPNPSL